MKIRNCAATVTENISEVRKLAVIKYPEQEKIMTERKAFDTSRYSHQQGLINDLASLAIESSVGLPLESRVNPFVLEDTGGGKVVNTALGTEDVLEYYSEASDLDRVEKEAGIKIKDCLLSQPEGILSIWISPPGGPLDHDEGRMVVGLNKKIDTTRFLESYGICTNFSPKECLDISKRLSIHTNSVGLMLEPEDLRGEVFVIDPPDGKPWDFLRENIPLDEVWNSIENGKANEIKSRAEFDAHEISVRTMGMIKNAKSEQDFIQAGAYAEMQMMEKGWNIGSGPCGSLNTDLLEETGTIIHSHVQMGPNGNVTGVRVEGGKYVHNCGECGKEINKVISSGYKCSCGGTYEGC